MSGEGGGKAHPLDRPVWSSLNTCHAGLAVVEGRARRFPTDVGTLAGVEDESAAAIADLGRLVKTTGPLGVINRIRIKTPQGVTEALRFGLVQSVHEGAMPDAPDGHRIEPLAEADWPEMLVLAELTVPGPYAARTPLLGQFYGIREGGRLIAMAGQRLRVPGVTEISGVCAHPGHRGRGLGRALSQYMTREVLRAGEKPFLHVKAENTAALRLYGVLGFKPRAQLHVLVLEP